MRTRLIVLALAALCLHSALVLAGSSAVTDRVAREGASHCKDNPEACLNKTSYCEDNPRACLNKSNYCIDNPQACVNKSAASSCIDDPRACANKAAD